MPVEVCREGTLARGQRIVDHRHRERAEASAVQHCGSDIDIVLDVDGDRYRRLYVDNLLGGAQ